MIDVDKHIKAIAGIVETWDDVFAGVEDATGCDRAYIATICLFNEMNTLRSEVQASRNGSREYIEWAKKKITEMEGEDEAWKNDTWPPDND